MKVRYIIIAIFVFFFLSFDKIIYADLKIPKRAVSKINPNKVQITGEYRIEHDPYGNITYMGYWGHLQIKHKRQIYTKGEVSIGGIKIPINNQTKKYYFNNLFSVSRIQALRIVVRCPLLFNDKIIIDGIVTGPYLRFTEPSSKFFNPYAKNFRVSWSEAFSRLILYIRDKNGIVFQEQHATGNFIKISPSVFANKGKFKFNLYGIKYLPIKGPVTSNSQFIFCKSVEKDSISARPERKIQ